MLKVSISYYLDNGGPDSNKLSSCSDATQRVGEGGEDANSIIVEHECQHGIVIRRFRIRQDLRDKAMGKRLILCAFSPRPCIIWHVYVKQQIY